MKIIRLGTKFSEGNRQKTNYIRTMSLLLSKTNSSLKCTIFNCQRISEKRDSAHEQASPNYIHMGAE